MSFSNLRETISSQSYHYDNSRRGDAPFVIIQRTEAGVGAHYWKRERSEVGPGMAFVAVVPEASRYAYEGCEEGFWQFSWINLYGPLGCQLARTLIEKFGAVLPMVEAGHAARLFYSLVSQRGMKSQVHEHSARCYEFLCAWTCELENFPPPSDPLGSVQEILRSRFREPLSMKMLAHEAGMSREHFTRLFAKRFGCGPAGMLRRVRLEEAERLKNRSELSLREIAMRCGFPSVRAMARVEKERTKAE